MNHEYLECACDSDEHVVRISYFVNKDGDFDDDEIYISVQLPDQTFWGYVEWLTPSEAEVPWWKVWKLIDYTPGRLWAGLRYIFGYKCKYGHWETTSVKYSSAVRLRELLDKYINSGLMKVGKDD